MTPGNPFPGLAYFGAADQTRFGGREREVATVAAAILRSRAFVLYGRSGLGKTSLLLAGVVPELERAGCRCVTVRALREPLADLHAALLGKLGDGLDEPSIDALIARAGEAGPVAVVFDQFEELFLRFGEQGLERGAGDRLPADEHRRRQQLRRGFVRELARLATRAELNLRLVFSLREEWIAEMQELTAEIPELEANRFRLLPLSAFGVRQSIRQALRAAGVDFDPRLVSALVEALAEVEFDPAVLQVVASEVWDNAVARAAGAAVSLGLDDLRATRGVRKVFEGYLEKVLRQVPPANRRLRLQTRAVLASLITPQRTKQALDREALLEQFFDVTPEELDAILGSLTEHRLVRCDRRGEETWYELIHERLVGPVLHWLDDDPDFFRLRAARNLVANSCAAPGWRENPELLLSQEQLETTVGPFAPYLRFGVEEREFLVSSAIYRDSPELESAAERAGAQIVLKVIERLAADSARPLARQRAATAAARSALRAGSLAERFLGLSTTDPDPAVRRASGEAFARLAGEEDFRELAAMLARAKEPKYRRAARETLADVTAAGIHPPTGIFSSGQLRRAGRRDRQRRVASVRFLLRKRARRGLWAGLWAGLAWALTTVGLWEVFERAEIAPQQRLGELWPSLAALSWSAGKWAVVIVPAGMLLGWLIARQAGLAAVRYGREARIWRAVASPWLVAGAVVTVLPLLTFSRLAAFVLPFSVPIAAAIVGCAAPLLWVSGTRLWRPLWAWLWAFGAGGALPALAWAMGGQLVSTGSGNANDFFGTSYSLWVTTGLVSLAGCLAIARSSPGFGTKFPLELELGEVPAPPVPTLRRQRAAAALTIAAMVVVLCGVANEFDVVPWREAKIRLPSLPSELPLRFGTAPIDTRWLSLENPGPTPRAVKVAMPWRWTLFAPGDVTQLNPTERALVLPVGRSRLAVQRKLPAAEGELRFELDRAGEGEIELTDDKWQLVRLNLERDGPDVWTGQLHGRLPAAVDHGERVLYLATLGWWRTGHREGSSEALELSGLEIARASGAIAAPSAGEIYDIPIRLTLRQDGEAAGGAGTVPATAQADPIVFLRLGFLSRGELSQSDTGSVDGYLGMLTAELAEVESTVGELEEKIRQSEVEARELPRQVAASDMLAGQDLEALRLRRQLEGMPADSTDRLEIEDQLEVLNTSREIVKNRLYSRFAADQHALGVALAEPALALELARRQAELRSMLESLRAQLRENQESAAVLQRWVAGPAPISGEAEVAR